VTTHIKTEVKKKILKLLNINALYIFFSEKLLEVIFLFHEKTLLTFRSII